MKSYQGSSEAKQRFDLIVVGSGSAGFAAAIRGSELGANVAICEGDVIGGTCVNRGCVPSKALLAAADLYYRAGHNPFTGIETKAKAVSLPVLIKSKDELVAELRRVKYEELAEEYGFAILRGRAAFLDDRTFACDGREFHADRYVIATGALPSVPPIPGLKETGYLTSTTALGLAELPQSLCVIGANAIGLELGQLFSQLGSHVVFLEALDRIAPFEEPEISKALERILQDEGAEVLPGVKVTGVERHEDRRLVKFEKDSSSFQLSVHEILVATGRRPNTEGMGLDLAGVELDGRGAIRVDETLATTNPRIFAAGDVTGSPQFVYVAAAQGALAAENALTGSGRSLDWRGLPRVIFTVPQVASVGLTTRAAQEAGHAVDSRVLDLAAVPRAILNRDTRGLVKIVADAPTGKVLGIHVLADSAGELAQAAVYAVRGDMTVTDMAYAWSPYLTMSEGLKLAAQSFLKDVKRLSCCAA